MNVFNTFPIGELDIETAPNWVSDVIKKALQDYDFGQDDNRDVEPIEFKRRDGFIPYRHNKGGFDKNSFTTLGRLSDNYGLLPNKLMDLINESIKDSVSMLVDRHPDILFNNIDPDDICYDTLYKNNMEKYAEELAEIERELLDDDYSSVMSQLRVMYHGYNNGAHSLTVFATVSYSDAPYHRSSDIQDEVTIYFKTEKELNKKLNDAIKKTSKVFLS